MSPTQPIRHHREFLSNSPTSTRKIWPDLPKSGQIWTFLTTSSENSQPTTQNRTIQAEFPSLSAKPTARRPC